MITNVLEVIIYAKSTRYRCTVYSVVLGAKTKLVLVEYLINKEFYTKHQTDSEVCDIDIGVLINFLVADLSGSFLCCLRSILARLLFGSGSVH